MGLPRATRALLTMVSGHLHHYPKLWASMKNTSPSHFFSYDRISVEDCNERYINGPTLLLDNLFSPPYPLGTLASSDIEDPQKQGS